MVVSSLQKRVSEGYSFLLGSKYVQLQVRHEILGMLGLFLRPKDRMQMSRSLILLAVNELAQMPPLLTP